MSPLFTFQRSGPVIIIILQPNATYTAHVPIIIGRVSPIYQMQARAKVSKCGNSSDVENLHPFIKQRPTKRSKRILIL